MPCTTFDVGCRRKLTDCRQPTVKSTIEINIPMSKKQKVVLGCADRNLAGSILAAFPGLQAETSETSEAVAWLLRGIRLHASKLLKELQEGDEQKAQLGLGHACRIFACLTLADRNMLTFLTRFSQQGQVQCPPKCWPPLSDSLVLSILLTSDYFYVSRITIVSFSQLSYYFPPPLFAPSICILSRYHVALIFGVNNKLLTFCFPVIRSIATYVEFYICSLNGFCY